MRVSGRMTQAALAQLGERQTEDLKVPGSIPGGGTLRAGSSPVAAPESQNEGTPGFEPGTIRTAAECSTTELRTRTLIGNATQR